MPRFVIRRPGEGPHVFELLGERPISMAGQSPARWFSITVAFRANMPSFGLRLRAAGRLLTVIARTG